MALQIDEQWNLKLFSNSYTTWKRVYQGDLVVFEEHHSIPTEVMKQIVNDHNMLIEVQALLSDIRDDSVKQVEMLKRFVEIHRAMLTDQAGVPDFADLIRNEVEPYLEEKGTSLAD